MFTKLWMFFFMFLRMFDVCRVSLGGHALRESFSTVALVTCMLAVSASMQTADKKKTPLMVAWPVMEAKLRNNSE